MSTIHLLERSPEFHPSPFLRRHPIETSNFLQLRKSYLKLTISLNTHFYFIHQTTSSKSTISMSIHTFNLPSSLPIPSKHPYHSRTHQNAILHHLQPPLPHPHRLCPPLSQNIPLVSTNVNRVLNADALEVQILTMFDSLTTASTSQQLRPRIRLRRNSISCTFTTNHIGNDVGGRIACDLNTVFTTITFG